MNTQQENRSIDIFIKLLCEEEIQWTRSSNTNWPDGILSIDNRKIALELTELITNDDVIHSNRKKLETMEHTLEDILEAKMRATLKDSGALLAVSIDLDIPRLNAAKIKILANKLFREIELHLDHRRITTAIKSEHIKINELHADVEIISSKRWSQITCNVGFRGCLLQNLSHAQIQSIVDRKKSIQKAQKEYDESWLLLIEGGDGSMRNEIDLTGKFRTWYDRLFLMKIIDGRIFELNKENDY